MVRGWGERLRVIVSETDRAHHHAAFVAIVRRARKTGMAGATVVRAIESFGATSHLHTVHPFRLRADVPVVVVIVDSAYCIDAFLPELDALIAHGIVVRQPVQIVGGEAITTTTSPSRTYRPTRTLQREGHMRLEGTGKRLTVYCGEMDRHNHRSLANAIVELAREEGLAGATVLRGIEGFGASTHLHTARIVDLSSDLPIVIEIIDREDRIMAVLPEIEEMMGDGLATLEDVDVWLYRAQSNRALDDEDDAPRL